MKKNLKFYLKDKLSEKDLELVPSSFDVVGDIMIFSDFPKELLKKEKVIGKAILENYHHVKGIFKKTNQYSGKFRTPKLKWILGDKRKETVYKENNVSIKLDVEKVYFSPRLSAERDRISDLVKPNETILVMFSGSGVYPIVIAKNSKCKMVYGIEINPKAHEYAIENVKKNKVENKIKLFKGDVKKLLPKIKVKFDRILMPLPKDAQDYLDIAFKSSKKGTILHLYVFLHEKEHHKAKEILDSACKKANKRYKILDIVKCGHYSPGFHRVSVDFEIK